MTDIRGIILGLGFDELIVTDAYPFGLGDGSLLIAIWVYEAATCDATDEAVIHPYYPASQRAYLAAREVSRLTGLQLRNDIPLKPVLAKLDRFCRGLNTLSYLEEYGSRFHIQTFMSGKRLEPTDSIQHGNVTRICSGCGRCVEACPTGAIRKEGFDRKRCLREWMLSGRVAPAEIRKQNGNRLIGCDVCESVCPMNAGGVSKATVYPLRELLRGQFFDLSEIIGKNLAVPNRILIQCCAIAGSLARADLIPELEALLQHPSERVREASCLALHEIKCLAKED